VRSRGLPRPTRAQVVLGSSSALCYAVGYPVAIAAKQPLAWVLVMLGGVLLFWLVGLTIVRVDRGIRAHDTDR
jgi:hypothetical protein